MEVAVEVRDSSTRLCNGQTFLFSETQAHKDLLSLLSCLQIVQRYLSADMVSTFGEEMYRQALPQNLASQAVTILLTDAEERYVDISACHRRRNGPSGLL